jgi:hypothetical protein
VRMQVFKSVDNLHSITLHFKLMKPFSSFQKLVHTLVMAKLQQNVDIVAVLEKMHKLSHVGMFHGSMNLNLTHQLLLGSAPLERGLLNDLGSSDGFGLALDKLIALCESSFSQEFSLDVLSIRNFSILMLDPLLDNLSGSCSGLSSGHQVGLTTAVLRSIAHWLSRGNTTTRSRTSRLSSCMKWSLTIVIRHIF